jgi:glucokinase
MAHKQQTYLPHFASNNRQGSSQTFVLAGDLGGTKTNLALFKATGEELELMHEHTYRTREYASFDEIIQHFIAQSPETPPARICIGVAGPVIKGKVALTNLSRDLSEEEIKESTSVKYVALINDLEATAYGLATLTPDNLLTLHKGNPANKGNMAILAPGTGLGEAGLYWDGNNYHPFPTEGGHCDFAPRTALDIELLQYLQEKYEIASWERLISGPGINNIYAFLRDVKGMEEPNWLTQALEENDTAAVISENGINRKAAICIKTMELFVRYLGRESANLVLKMKATGGLFLGGGIPPKIASLLENNDFYNHYLQCDRMVELLSAVPIHIINNDKTALWGAAYFGAAMNID